MTVDPDPLFWMLDSIADHDGEYLVLQAQDEAERFVQALSVGGGLLDVEWRASSADELHRLAAVRVLVAHQTVLRCLRDAGGWDTVAAETAADGEVDYATTGLSIANAVMDRTKRQRQLGLPVEIPPVVRWGGHDVTGGDIWRDLHGEFDVLVRAEAGRDGWRQGISIAARRPVLSTADGPEQAEILLWPGDAGSRFTVRARMAGDDLRVTNVFRPRDGSHARIERWIGNAGFRVSTESPTLRRYHANFHEVSPPTFDDLVFSVEVQR